MCLNPRLIANPLYKSERVFLKDKSGRDYSFDVACKNLKGRTLQYIYVPCGTCAECLQSKQNSFIQRCQTELLVSYMYFITLTYKNDMLPRLTDSLGNVYFYPDSDGIQKMFKRIRQKNLISRPFTYAAFSEYGKQGHRPHWHIMLFVQKEKKDHEFVPINLQEKLYDVFFNEWRINVGSDKYPVYKKNFEFHRSGRFRNFDLHYVNPCSSDNGENDVAFYCSKYLLKVDNWIKAKFCYIIENLDYKEYRELRNKIRPKSLVSKGFGLHHPVQIGYVRNCIDKSLKLGYDMLKFINPYTGDLYPLGRYFKERLVTSEDLQYCLDNHIDTLKTGDMSFCFNARNINESKVDKFRSIQKRIYDSSDFEILE